MPEGVKPQKPSPEFPLYAHARGRWAKKIAGKVEYFGRWDDPDGAFQEYVDFLRPKLPDVITGISLEDASCLFLEAKEAAYFAKTLSQRSFSDYRRTLKRFCEFIGRERRITTLTPNDFQSYKIEFSKTNNPVAVGNEITRIKSCLNWLVKAEHIENPIKCGPEFVKPTAVVARRHKREMGRKLYTPEELHAILDESGLRMRAMILLGINCGYHNADVESLPLQTLQSGMRSGILEHARRKTEIERACPLWEETQAALEAWLSRRPKSDSKMAFVLHNGRELSQTNADVAKRFRMVRDAAGVHAGGYSWLRKTFATYAGDGGDQVAVNFVMGHVDGTTPGVYRQLIRDHRLHRAVDLVRKWLFG